MSLRMAHLRQKKGSAHPDAGGEVGRGAAERGCWTPGVTWEPDHPGLCNPNGLRLLTRQRALGQGCRWGSSATKSSSFTDKLSACRGPACAVRAGLARTLLHPPASRRRPARRPPGCRKGKPDRMRLRAVAAGLVRPPRRCAPMADAVGTAPDRSAPRPDRWTYSANSISRSLASIWAPAVTCSALMVPARSA